MTSTNTPDFSDELVHPSVEDIQAILQFLPEFERPDFSPGHVHKEKGQFPWFEYCICLIQ